MAAAAARTVTAPPESEPEPQVEEKPHVGPMSRLLVRADARALLAEKHAQYCVAVIVHGLPKSHQGLDSNRLTILHFALAGLDCLGQLSLLSADHRQMIVDWVYGLEVRSADSDPP
eukprot:COSAG05_NODE_8304_length_716_cov_1.333874_1_plen_115_part_10